MHFGYYITFEMRYVLGPYWESDFKFVFRWYDFHEKKNTIIMNILKGRSGGGAAAGFSRGFNEFCFSTTIFYFNKLQLY